jgi:hypothetical protein
MEPVTLLEKIENLYPARLCPLPEASSSGISQGAANTAQYFCDISIEENLDGMDGISKTGPCKKYACWKELRLCENVPATGMPVPSCSAPFNNWKRETDRCASRKLHR